MTHTHIYITLQSKNILRYKIAKAKRGLRIPLRLSTPVRENLAECQSNEPCRRVDLDRRSRRLVLLEKHKNILSVIHVHVQTTAQNDRFPAFLAATVILQ